MDWGLRLWACDKAIQEILGVSSDGGVMLYFVCVCAYVIIE